MQPRPKYQVFISSTYGDLRDEREAVTWAILSARHIPAGMENFTATDDRGWETIKSVIDRSDYYVLILAGRYGSVYRRGKSWTEKEYEYAVLRNIPVLAFIRAKRSIRADAMDEDSGLRAKLEGFKRKVRDRHLCREWDERADLVAEVSNALSNHIRDDEQGGRQRPGWYRGDELSSLQNFDFAEPVEGFIAEAIQLDNTGPVYCYAFSLDSRLALTGGRDKAVRLWDLETRRCVRLFEGHGKAVECISWSADQRCVLSASDDRTVRRWDVKTGRCLSVLDGHTGDVWSVAWSPDQRYACSGSGDHTVRLWDLEAGTCVSILEGTRTMFQAPNGVQINLGCSRAPKTARCGYGMLRRNSAYASLKVMTLLSIARSGVRISLASCPVPTTGLCGYGMLRLANACVSSKVILLM